MSFAERERILDTIEDVVIEHGGYVDETFNISTVKTMYGRVASRRSWETESRAPSEPHVPGAMVIVEADHRAEAASAQYVLNIEKVTE